MWVGGMAGVIGDSGAGSGLGACSDPLAGDLAGLEDLVRVLVNGSVG